MKTFFKKIHYRILLKRMLLLIIPIILMPLGIACYYCCGLGSDPFSVFVEGEHMLSGFTYGEITTCNNIVLLGVMLLVGRKYLNIGTIVTSFTAGPLIDFFMAAIKALLGQAQAALGVQIAVLAVGCVLFAVGVASYIAVDLGIGAVEFVSLVIVDATKIKLKFVRIALDALFVVAGFLMGGVVGVGTIVGIAATGPIVEFSLSRLQTLFSKFAQPDTHGCAA